jgi:hypothetical protein
MLLRYKTLVRLHFNCQTIKFMQEKGGGLTATLTAILTATLTKIPYLRYFKQFDNPLYPPKI